ncbi:MAG: DUF6159 family protein [Acidimicrobiales bacterium]
MAGRFSNSMDLLKSSWAVLKADKELTAIPVLNGVLASIIAVAMGAGVFLTVNRTYVPRTGQYEYTAGPITYVVGILGYFLITLVVTFFTGALVAGAYQRLTGGDPSLGSAFGAASRRFPQLLGWALLAGTVGYLLRALRERAGIFGFLLGGLLEFAWEVITWLAVPAIIVEGNGPITTLKTSASLLKRTWGENLIGQFGFGLVGFLAILPGLLVGGLITIAIPFVGIPIMILWVVAVSVVISTLTGIYRTALYCYATTGQAPQGFDQQVMAGAFRPKQGLIR